jgi:hypothetical protein
VSYFEGRPYPVEVLPEVGPEIDKAVLGLVIMVAKRLDEMDSES